MLSLSVDPPSIAEEDDDSTPDDTENVSTVTVGITNAKTFAEDRTVTLTFSGAAASDYSVSPEDADPGVDDHQVVLPMETASVEVTVTAAGNDTADGNLTLTVAGDLDGTVIGTTDITIRDDETTTNNDATGKPAITGTPQVGQPQVGQTLEVDVSAIMDADGKTNADNGVTGYAYTYQWILVDGATETDIAGETESTYTPVATDVDKKIKVRVSFIDDAGNPEEPLPSDATAAVIARDSTAPEVTSIERQVPTTSPTNADSLTWLVTFDEDVANVDATDFEVDGTTAPLGFAAVPGSATQYEVTASGGDLAGLNATVTLSFASAQEHRRHGRQRAGGHHADGDEREHVRRGQHRPDGDDHGGSGPQQRTVHGDVHLLRGGYRL